MRSARRKKSQEKIFLIRRHNFGTRLGAFKGLLLCLREEWEAELKVLSNLLSFTLFSYNYEDSETINFFDKNLEDYLLKKKDSIFKNDGEHLSTA